MSRLDKYPSNPVFETISKGGKTVKPLLPWPQPDVSIYEGKMTKPEFNESIDQTFDAGFEEHRLLYARVIGAVMVYGQFSLSGAKSASTYIASRSFVPKVDMGSFEQAGYQPVPNKTCLMVKQLAGSRKDLHYISMPNNSGLDYAILASATQRSMELRRAMLRALDVNNLKPSDDTVIPTLAMRAQLGEWFNSLYGSRVCNQSKLWADDSKSVEEWSGSRINRIYKGIQMSIEGAEKVAGLINAQLGITEEAEPGVTVCIPVLHPQEGSVHPLHDQMIAKDGQELEGMVHWHAERALSVYGSTLDEVYGRIVRGETL